MTKLVGPAVAAGLVAVLVSAPAPARAQFGGDDQMMTQMAPMLNMMKARMGKQRYGQLMRTMGPMMANMMDGGGGGFGGFGGGGFGGGYGGYGGYGGSMGGFGSMMGMMGAFDMGSLRGMMGGGRSFRRGRR